MHEHPQRGTVWERLQVAYGARSRPGAGGFTLLEVVVAITILAVVLGVALELLGVGLRSARASSDTTQAVFLAQQKLQEIALQDLTPRTLTGTDGGYTWSAEIAQSDSGSPNRPAQLVTLRVTVRGSGTGGRVVELVTLRLADGNTAPVSLVVPAGRLGVRPGAGQ